ncbi:hypothetical protein MASR2M69_07580 [Bacteroidota bacterium]
MKTALYFGSFNPMHLGHITICRYLLEKTEIDQLRLVVSPGNPLKSAENFKNARQRLICAQNIIKEEFPNYNIVVSDIEFQLVPPLYTINTIRYLKESEPGNQFILVIGSDNLAIIEKWHKWQELLSETEIWVYPEKVAMPGSYATNTAAACWMHLSLTSPQLKSGNREAGYQSDLLTKKSQRESLGG